MPGREKEAPPQAAAAGAVCGLCPHACRIAPGGIGFCRARGVPAGGKHGEEEKRAEAVVSLSYGKLTSIALDPIEKKPLYHFYPGSKILSVGSFGCNLRCPWCQNYSISAAGPADAETRETEPEALADLAERYAEQGNIGVAFTYNEPLIGFEYVRDTSQILKARGLKSVLVTNGFATPSYFEELLPLIDAMNIDLKSVNPDFYTEIGGDLDIVLENIRLAAARCHIELTCLLMDGENDSEGEMSQMTDFIAAVSPEIPLHISRFFPRYQRTDREPTQMETLRKFEKIARRKLKYVYLGNV
ncbi:MAG: AmmeMemoRadiSam system radical SAM enzyme [Clostridiales bacterium]|nr:AmmeMemoRadiSam system radical SAM enzyme [Clostridiales bacterium]